MPVAAEFRHGVEAGSLILPGGKVVKEEDIHSCAKREFEEETGIVLEDVIGFNPAWMPISQRQSTERVYFFLGIPRFPLVVEPHKPDQDEFLKVVVMPLYDWLELISQGRELVDSHSALLTLLALRHLGRLKFR